MTGLIHGIRCVWLGLSIACVVTMIADANWSAALGWFAACMAISALLIEAES